MRGMTLDDLLRRCVLNDKSISHVSRETGVPQATLQEFAVGKADGSYADIRISSALKLMEYYGIESHVDLVRTRPRRSKQMRLAVELEAHGYQDSPEKFEEWLIETLIGFFAGYTIDDLLCTPQASLKYCINVREGVGASELIDSVILKSLINIRKRKSCPTGLKATGRRTVLKTALRKAGCELHPDTYKELLVDCLADMYKGQTIDELVCHPNEAIAFCGYVRRKASCQALPDTLILRPLMNVRKAAET